MSDEKKSIGFVDYYNSNNIIPVSQNLSDFSAHLYRRNFLYQTLGVPLHMTKGMDIVEFGPGGAYNALATAHFKPNSYTFVEKSIASIAEINRKQAANLFGDTRIEIRDNTFMEFPDKKKYDLVICEGAIPGQVNPHGTLRHIASACAEGGIVIITTMSATSLLAELCRRVLRPCIVTPDRSFEEQTAFGAAMFKPHLETLGTSTRPAADWVQDVILHDWSVGQYIFTMPDAVEALGNEFEFYGSSPRFLIDDRWYKGVSGRPSGMNDLLKTQYPVLSAALLDYRVGLGQVMKIGDLGLLAEIDRLCDLARAAHDTVYGENSFAKVDAFIELLTRIAALLPDAFACTRSSIADYISALRLLVDGDTNPDWGSFPAWWGRGQQYISLVSSL